MLSTTYREETPSAGLYASNGQGNDWDDPVEEGLISAKDAGRKRRELMEWLEETEVPEGARVRRRREIQILTNYASKLRGRLGGGRDPWQEPPGGLTVVVYAIWGRRPPYSQGFNWGYLRVSLGRTRFVNGLAPAPPGPT